MSICGVTSTRRSSPAWAGTRILFGSISAHDGKYAAVLVTDGAKQTLCLLKESCDVWTIEEANSTVYDNAEQENCLFFYEPNEIVFRVSWNGFGALYTFRRIDQAWQFHFLTLYGKNESTSYFYSLFMKPVPEGLHVQGTKQIASNGEDPVETTIAMTPPKRFADIDFHQIEEMIMAGLPELLE